jgi:hypothetical protein
MTDPRGEALQQRLRAMAGDPIVGPLCSALLLEAVSALSATPASASSDRAALIDACNVALGHLTGGLDGDWRDCDAAALLRDAIHKATAK